jgi:hypothetical protein
MIFFAPTLICLLLTVFLVKTKDDRRAVSVYALLPLIIFVGAKEVQQAHPENYLGAPLLIFLYPISLFAFLFEEIYRYYTVKRIILLKNFMVATSFIVIFELFLKLSGKLSDKLALIEPNIAAGIGFGTLLHLCNALIMWYAKSYEMTFRRLTVLFCIVIHYLFNAFAYAVLQISVYLLPLLFLIYLFLIFLIYRKNSFNY